MKRSEPFDPLPPLYTVAYVCAYLHVHRSTLERFIDQGRLEVVHIGRQVRITRDALDRFLAEEQRRNIHFTDEVAVS